MAVRNLVYGFSWYAERTKILDFKELCGGFASLVRVCYPSRKSSSTRCRFYDTTQRRGLTAVFHSAFEDHFKRRFANVCEIAILGRCVDLQYLCLVLIARIIKHSSSGKIQGSSKVQQ